MNPLKREENVNFTWSRLSKNSASLKQGNTCRQHIYSVALYGGLNWVPP